jgi:type IV pilus assembly protein PilC
MTDKLNSGASLSQAFKEHKRHFDSVYLNMVEAGEISGKLDVFLDRLVEMLEKQQAIRAGIKSALFYPVTLVVITVGISYFMLTNVVPTFQDMYEGLGAELPGPTQAIVDASNWIQDGSNLMRVIGTVLFFWITNKTLTRFVRPYRKLKSIIALRLPLVGDIIVKATVARMSLLMANLLAAGVSVIDTLEVSKTVSSNVQFLDVTARIKDKITTGAPLSQLFGNEAVFPIALAQLMAVGERTGNMDEMLTSIAKYYEEEFTAVVDGLSTIIEPLMIVFVGLMIGVMVVALYLPIFSAGDAIR